VIGDGDAEMADVANYPPMSRRDEVIMSRRAKRDRFYSHLRAVDLGARGQGRNEYHERLNEMYMRRQMNRVNKNWAAVGGWVPSSGYSGTAGILMEDVLIAPRDENHPAGDIIMPSAPITGQKRSRPQMRPIVQDTDQPPPSGPNVVDADLPPVPESVHHPREEDHATGARQSDSKDFEFFQKGQVATPWKPWGRKPKPYIVPGIHADEF